MVYETAKGFIQVVGPCLAIHGVGWALLPPHRVRVPCVVRWQHSLHADCRDRHRIPPIRPDRYGHDRCFIGAVGGMFAYTVIVSVHEGWRLASADTREPRSNLIAIQLLL